jgi:alpha/beta hydrolase family protein
VTRVITLPPVPRPVPPLVADPGAVRSFAADVLAASAQLDDLGTFVAGDARIADWEGVASSAYHRAIAPTGRRADAMSLALRWVSRRADAHADLLQRLLDRRSVLAAERARLVETISELRTQANGAPVGAAAAVQDACDDCARRVRCFEADLDTWSTDVIAAEEEMCDSFARVGTLDRVEQRYAGAADPADAALATAPDGHASPAEVKTWWDGLSRTAQLALLAASPGSVGNRDGIPPWARDAANTVALDRDLADWGQLEEEGLLTDDEAKWLGNARAARDAREAIGQGLDPVTREPIRTQLYLYDPTAFGGDGAVAVSAGDLGTADNVAVVVPGFGTDGESAAYQGERALTLYEASRNLDGGQTNASMFWIGYDAPDNAPWDEGWDGAGVVSEDLATRGGDRLADTVDGLRDSRNGTPAHLTVIGHSYGSTTLGHAAHDHGLPANDLVFVGSPGVGGDTDHADDLRIDPDHVWAGANSRDPIAALGNHGWFHLESAMFGAGLGDDPVEDAFGAHRFEAESTTRADDDGLDALADHAKYFDHDTESLYDIGQVVNGDYDAVLAAGHLTDPWYTEPQDPEWDRRPTSPDTDGRP